MKFCIHGKSLRIVRRWLLVVLDGGFRTLEKLVVNVILRAYAKNIPDREVGIRVFDQQFHRLHTFRCGAVVYTVSRWPPNYILNIDVCSGIFQQNLHGLCKSISTGRG